MEMVIPAQLKQIKLAKEREHHWGFCALQSAHLIKMIKRASHQAVRRQMDESLIVETSPKRAYTLLLSSGRLMSSVSCCLVAGSIDRQPNYAVRVWRTLMSLAN